MTRTDKVKDKYSMEKDADLQKFALLFWAKKWLIVGLTIVGCVVGALCYILYTQITNGETKYQISTDYYIFFNEKEYPNGMDYYNAYTWNQFITDDYIVDYALTVLPDDITKEDIANSVSCVMLGDYRVLTVRVTSTDQQLVREISEAYKLALPNFANYIPQIVSIDIWSCDDMIILEENTKVPNAAVVGGIIAFIISCFGFAIAYTLDDKIYTQKDIAGFFPEITFIGYDSDNYRVELEANKKKLIGDKKIEEIVADSNLDVKEKSCVINIPMGKIKATQLTRRLDFLNTQKIEVVGVVITECDDRFLKRYYR